MSKRHLQTVVFPISSWRVVGCHNVHVSPLIEKVVLSNGHGGSVLCFDAQHKNHVTADSSR